MKRVALVAALAGLHSWVTASVAAAQAQPGVRWHSDAYEAYQQALTRELPLIVYFTADWSQYGKNVEQDVFDTPLFWPYWSRGIYLKAVDEQDDSVRNKFLMAERLDIDRYPVLVVLQAWQGRLGEVGRITGHHAAATYLRQLDFLLDRWKTRVALEKPSEPGVLNDMTLGEMLRGLGLQPVLQQYPVGGLYYQLGITRDTWTYDIRVSLDADGHKLLLTSPLSHVPATQQGHGEHVLRLLAENEKMGTTHFAFESTTRRISMHRSVPNLGMTVAILQSELNDFMALIKRTHALWEPASWKAPRED